MQLFIVPLVLTVLGLLFTTIQQERASLEREQQQAFEQQREEQQRALEAKRAEAEQDLAEQRAQDESLQAYLDQMSSLLLENDLRASDEDSEVRTLARARTLTVLARLDPSRQGRVMQFLGEADLLRQPIISLNKADLSGADLSGIDLTEADLSGANLSGTNLYKAKLDGADLTQAKMGLTTLREADLTSANLTDADLGLRAGLDYLESLNQGTNFGGPPWADLSGANLLQAKLSGANLSGVFMQEADPTYANLTDTNLRGALLGGANLFEANLSHADLTRAVLTKADLTGADLSGAYEYPTFIKPGEGWYIKDQAHKELVDTAKLEKQAASLEGATMPNGWKHP
jgi:uncharacterized protein YjbI with pentapeptide repeats